MKKWRGAAIGKKKKSTTTSKLHQKLINITLNLNVTKPMKPKLRQIGSVSLTTTANYLTIFVVYMDGWYVNMHDCVSIYIYCIDFAVFLSFILMWFYKFFFTHSTQQILTIFHVVCFVTTFLFHLGSVLFCFVFFFFVTRIRVISDCHDNQAAKSWLWQRLIVCRPETKYNFLYLVGCFPWTSTGHKYKNIYTKKKSKATEL